MPADSDLFKGGSHQNVADRMAEVIKEQEINILGLEGELGSGKSTIIHFLKKSLSPEYTFIDFDAEIYHYGNTKKALIEVIHDGLSESKGANKDNLDKLKNTALGNIVKYDKRVSSRLSWWTVSFILLCLLSVQMVRYLILDINANVKIPGTISGLVIYLEIFLALSPGMLLLWLLVIPKLNLKSWWAVSFGLLCLFSIQVVSYLILDINSNAKNSGAISGLVIAIEIIAALTSFVLLLWILLSQKLNAKPRGNLEDVTTVGDLFKQNSTDSITEKWLISREIGTIELTNALAGFTSSSSVSTDAKFILIIDNLDRINADKVKELWSDMELIAGTTHRQFRIIVPYSARHVAKSLLLEGHTGREFISKRIPVTFTVPPLITAGWQDTFREMWKETVNERIDISCAETMQILERWRTVEYPRMTPRLLKKLVNDVHILLMTVPAEAPEEYVLLALYVVFVRYNESDVMALLRSDENDPINMQPNEYEDKLQATKAQLNRLFMNDTNRWSEYLMSIHFQASVELARTELFDLPLTEAVNKQDAIALEKLTGMYGFSHAWQRCAGRFTMYDWMETAIKLSDDTLIRIKEELTGAVARLNAIYALSERENFRESFTQSLKLLEEKGYLGTEDFMVRQKNHVVTELNKLQKTPENDEVYIRELLREADLYSAIFKENLLALIDSDLSGKLYSMYLLNEKENLPNLYVSTLKLSEEEQENMLRHILETESHGIFNPDVIRFFDLSSRAVEHIIENERDNLPVNIVSKLGLFRNSGDNEDIEDLRYVIFNPEWYDSQITPSLKKQTLIKENYPEEYAAHLVANLVVTKNYSEIESYAEDFEHNESYIKYLSYYLRYVNSFSIVLDALKDAQSSAYVKEAIRILFIENHLGYINTVDYVNTYYPILKSELSDVDCMSPIVSREIGLLKGINEKNIAKISEDFLEDIFSKNQFKKFKERLHIISQDIISSKEQLYGAFKAIESNRSLILRRMASAGKYVHMTVSISFFADWYRNIDLTQLKTHNNVRLIWSCLIEEQRSEILKELHDVLMEVDTLKEKRIKIIQDFHDVINFSEPEGRASRRAIAALFGLASGDEKLRSWLNAQQFTFSAWPKAEADTVSQVINENQMNFPDIISRSSFIRNRLPVLAPEQDDINAGENKNGV
nr:MULTISPECIES: P-loop NTPase fold protein [unclassified Pantoea]